MANITVDLTGASFVSHSDKHHEGGADEVELNKLAVTGDLDMQGHDVSGIGSVSAETYQVFDVTKDGAVADGSADSAPDINSTIDDAQAAGGGVVYFPEGIYRIDSQLTVDASNVVFAGDGSQTSQIDATNIGTGTYPVSVAGSDLGGWAIQSASTGDVTVTFSNSSATDDFSEGQLAKITSNDLFRDTDVEEGEMNVVESVDASNDQVTFKRPLQADYASSPQVRVIDGVDNFQWRSLGLHNSSKADAMLGMSMDKVTNCLVTDSYWKDTGQRAIGFGDSINVIIEKSLFEGMAQSGYGYGVNVGGGATSSRIRDCTFRDTRHAVAHSSGVSDIVRGSVVEGCTCTQPNYDQALDAHSECEYITFRDNECHNSGISLRGYHQRAIDNYLVRPSNYAFSCSGATIQRNLTIGGNTIIEPQTQGIVIAGGSGVQNFVVEDNTYEGPTDNSVNFMLANGPIDGGSICDNEVRWGAYSVYLRNVDDVTGLTRQGLTINNNTVRDSTEGVYFADGAGYTNCTVVGNVLFDNTRNLYLSGVDDGSTSKVAHNTGDATHNT